MGRQPVASKRLPAQRPTAEFCDLQDKNTELKQSIDELSERLRVATNNWTYYQLRMNELKHELDKAAPPSLDGKRTAVGKLVFQGTPFYEHAEFLYHVLNRFDSSDIPLLITTVLRKLSREREDTDFCWRTMMTDGFRSAREALLHSRDEKIAQHLREQVYTADHFSLLRLVGNISKRVCCLIDQSIKWVHESDGSKTRQMLCPGSNVPAPSLFALSAINAAEAKAEAASQLTLHEHADRKGADICGQPHGLDRAMMDSITHTSRAGGMATKGTEDSPHLMCITGDGAGLTGRDSGVRVAHFPGSTNLMNQSSLDYVNWLFYKEACKAEDYTVLAGRLHKVLPDLRRIYKTKVRGAPRKCIHLQGMLVHFIYAFRTDLGSKSE